MPSSMSDVVSLTTPPSIINAVLSPSPSDPLLPKAYPPTSHSHTISHFRSQIWAHVSCEWCGAVCARNCNELFATATAGAFGRRTFVCGLCITEGPWAKYTGKRPVRFERTVNNGTGFVLPL
jgi:hypothetical protein